MSRASVLATTFLASLVIAGRSQACCNPAWEICGTAVGGGTVTVEVRVNNTCTPMPLEFAVSIDETSESICQRIEAAWDPDCVIGGALCGFTCVATGPGCWVLLDERDCPFCVTVTKSECCGITIEPVDTLSPLP